MAEELTLTGELDRQFRLVRRGESQTVVCPSCGSINNSESGDCCEWYASAQEELAELHLKQAAARFAAFRNKLADSVECPYCGGINRIENFQSPAHWKRPMVSPYCCTPMDYAAHALGKAVMQQKQIDHMRRIQDGIAKASAN